MEALTERRAVGRWRRGQDSGQQIGGDLRVLQPGQGVAHQPEGAHQGVVLEAVVVDTGPLERWVLQDGGPHEIRALLDDGGGRDTAERVADQHARPAGDLLDRSDRIADVSGGAVLLGRPIGRSVPPEVETKDPEALARAPGRTSPRYLRTR